MGTQNNFVIACILSKTHGLWTGMQKIKITSEMRGLVVTYIGTFVLLLFYVIFSSWEVDYLDEDEQILFLIFKQLVYSEKQQSIFYFIVKTSMGWKEINKSNMKYIKIDIVLVTFLFCVVFHLCLSIISFFGAPGVDFNLVDERNFRGISSQISQISS